MKKFRDKNNKKYIYNEKIYCCLSGVPQTFSHLNVAIDASKQCSTSTSKNSKTWMS